MTKQEIDLILWNGLGQAKGREYRAALYWQMVKKTSALKLKRARGEAILLKKLRLYCPEG